jgi:cell division protein FtsQ
MEKGKIVSIEERIPKLKQQRKRKTNRRVILLLTFFFLIILIVVYLRSPFSHIQDIEVNGNSVIDNENIIKASNLKINMNIWSVKPEEVEKSIKKIEEIKLVNVKRKFPTHVIISVKEFDRVAYLKKDRSFQPILENGTIVHEDALKTAPSSTPILLHFEEGKTLKKLLDELDKLPTNIVHSISEIQSAPKKTDPEHIILYMNDGFEVSATLPTFSEKMKHYPAIISQLNPSTKGIIDLEVGSFFQSYQHENDNDQEVPKTE